MLIRIGVVRMGLMVRLLRWFRHLVLMVQQGQFFRIAYCIASTATTVVTCSNGNKNNNDDDNNKVKTTEMAGTNNETSTICEEHTIICIGSSWLEI
jgi:hypothetical protein